jgi:Ser/Thr protein kinase RdoA (MazF antagonist)
MRTVSVVVTCGTACLGAVGPFAVDVPWWADVAPVVAGVRARLGVPVTVLRLLATTGEGARDGHVTYHVEAAEPPSRGLGPAGVGYDDLVAPQRFRAPWATAAGVRELLGWATGRLAAAGRPATGPAEQHRTWNLAALFRLPTAAGPVWLKATPHFAADEAVALAAIARHDPALVPDVVAAGPGRLLLEHVPGGHNLDAPDEVIANVLGRFAGVQAIVAPPPGLPDRRDLAGQVRALLDDGVPELTPDERAAARRLTGRFAELAACGLPDTLVHGDFHPVNWIGDPPVVLDLADAHLGNPVLDGLRAVGFLPAKARPAAARAWVRAWTDLAPGSAPARALAVAEPLAHLAHAVRYQEFLDGIEPSERVYHDGDPAAAIRAALRAARSA